MTLARCYPYTLGANIGTTVTALLAAMASGSVAALTVAWFLGFMLSKGVTVGRRRQLGLLLLMSALALLLSALLLSACGFQPRGQALDLSTVPDPVHASPTDMTSGSTLSGRALTWNPIRPTSTKLKRPCSPGA